MPVIKSIELTGESTKGWEDAVKVCVAEAARTVKNIRKIEVLNHEGVVEANQVQLYTVTCKLSFVIDDSLR
jgi:flavin-binding protein dodecin